MAACTVFRTPPRINATKCPGAGWDFAGGGDKVRMKARQPAAFPDRPPHICIHVFTRPGELALEPMAGSGSTLVAAKLLGRRYLGGDIGRERCALSRTRLATMRTNLDPRFENAPPGPSSAEQIALAG